MDISGVVDFPTICVWIVLMGLLLYVYATWPYTYLASYGYTGPKPQPFLGNLHLRFAKGFFGSADLELKKKYGKVFGMYEGRLPTIVVYDTDILQHILVQQFSCFHDRKPSYMMGKLKNALVYLKGAEWTRVRKMVSPMFTGSRLRQYLHVLKVPMDNLDRHLKLYSNSEKAFEAKSVIGAFTLEAILRVAFGEEISSQDNPEEPLYKLSVLMVERMKPNYRAAKFAYAFPFLLPLMEFLGFQYWPKKAMDFYTEFVKSKIKERQLTDENYNDYIQMLVKAHEEEMDNELQQLHGVMGVQDRGKALTEDEILAQAVMFILAGVETSATTLSFFLLQMALHPDIQDRVHEEIAELTEGKDITYDVLKTMTYTDMCLDETLRLYPGFQRIYRQCTESTTINGYYFPKGVLVAVPIYAIHRDPELWDDPDSFIPERFSPERKAALDPCAYMPFGAGPKTCIGKRLGLAEVKIALARMIRLYRIKLDQKTNLPIKLTGQSFLPKVEGGIWLKLENRQMAP